MDGGQARLTLQVPELRQRLLAWWDVHGRHAIPWKLRHDGSRPADGEAIDPYGVFVAEVMRAARQHKTWFLGSVCFFSSLLGLLAQGLALQLQQLPGGLLEGDRL